MNILNNRNKRTSIFKAVALCLIAAVSFTLVSCDDDMDIQQSYPFTVKIMPVPNKVTKGQTVEIRCELKKEGDFSGTLYTIRYFQFEGEGSLKMDNGITFLPNDRYLLEYRYYHRLRTQYHSIRLHGSQNRRTCEKYYCSPDRTTLDGY